MIGVIGKIGEMLMGRLAGWGAIGIAVAVLFTAWQFDRARQRGVGAERERANVERSNRAIVDRSRVVRDRVADSRVRGTIDPHAVAE